MDYIGMVVLGIFFAAAFILLVTVRYKNRHKNEHYDERQVLVRGKGFRLGYMVMCGMNLVYGCFLYGFTKSIVSPQFVALSIVFLGILVYAVYCIFNDAYLQVGQKSGKWIGITLLVIASNLISFFMNKEQGLNVNGFATGKSLNLMIVVVFSVVLISFIIKKLIDRSES